jgi:hypothetical protein
VGTLSRVTRLQKDVIEDSLRKSSKAYLGCRLSQGIYFGMETAHCGSWECGERKEKGATAYLTGRGQRHSWEPG